MQGSSAGTSVLATLFCNWARLPLSVAEGPVRFTLQVDGEQETWSRFFSGSGPMVSRVAADKGLLVERLGPAMLRFELAEREGMLHWNAVSLRVLGIPVPRRLFEFRARVSGQGARYAFDIDANLALVGRLIRYQGVLDVHS